MKKAYQKIAIVIIGIIAGISIILFAQALYGILIERWGKMNTLIASSSIIAVLILLGFIGLKDFPMIKRLGRR